MDIGLALKGAGKQLKKYKYPLIVLLVGIILMVIPTGSKKQTQGNMPEATEAFQVSTEEKLAEILSSIKGAGNVKVMLTIQAGEEYFYQADTNATQSDATSSTTTDTVILTDKNRTQSPLIRQILGPKYQGAIILCTGANDPSVKLSIIDAVSKITGLGSDKISVLELK